MIDARPGGFTSHQRTCNQCAGVNPKDTATIGRACLDGARLLKDIANAHVRSRSDMGRPKQVRRSR